MRFHARPNAIDARTLQFVDKRDDPSAVPVSGRLQGDSRDEMAAAQAKPVPSNRRHED
jgi:hypothetical protein